MSQNDRSRAAQAKSLLRQARAGDRVTGTIHGIAGRVGRHGTIIDPQPFEPDGVARVIVEWDDIPTATHTLPTSITLDRLDADR